MAARNDSRRTPPQDRFGVPQIQRPTPNILDFVIVESIPMRNDRYVALLRGTPHPTKPTALLVDEKPVQGSNQEKSVTRIYCTSRTGQDAYNARLDYAQGNNAYPRFTRTYFLPRDGYVAATKLLALTSLVGLKRLTGGSGYLGGGSGQIPLSFAGGSGGTGAAGLAEVVKGAVVAVLLTDGGSAYLSVPTVGLVGACTVAATATAILQPATCLLTHEDAVPEEGEFLSLFFRVTRVYETLPGPEIPTLKDPDKQTATDQTVYAQRVAIGTSAYPVSSIKIQGVAVGNPTTITLDYPHGIPVASTFQVRIAGVKGSTPTIDGDYTMTSTGANTFTIPVHVTVAATANLGFLSFLKGGQVIIESYIKPDEDAGSVAGTLITTCVTLPGRESSDPEYDEERAAFVNEYRQYVVTGTDSRTAGATYKGQTIEKSDCADPFARSHLSEGPAMALLVTKTILLPGDPLRTPLFDEETGALQELVRTRVDLSSTLPDTIGSTYDAGPPALYVVESKVLPENVAVGVLTSLASALPPGRIVSLPGSHPQPRVFGNTITGWVYSGDGYQIHGPFLGVNYTMKIHPDATPLIGQVTYTLGRDVSTISKFAVTSHRSRFLPIDGYMIHPAYSLTETSGAGTQTIEDMPVSVPSTYPSTPTVLDLTLHEHPWRGGEDGIWERTTIQFVTT